MPRIRCNRTAKRRPGSSNRSPKTNLPRPTTTSNWPEDTWRRGIGSRPASSFRNLIASHGTEPRYLVAYVNALLDHGEMNNADIYLERLEKISPNLSDSVALRARMLVVKNEPEKALDLLKAFVDKPNAQPPDRNVRLRAVASCLEYLSGQLTQPVEKPLAERLGRQAETFYRAYLEKNPGHEAELVAFCARQGRTDEALDLFDRIWDNCSPAVVDQICELMTQRHMGADQLRGASAAFCRQPSSASAGRIRCS